MITISESIKQLEKFSSRKDVLNIINQLRNLKTDKIAQEETIFSLRAQLKLILETEKNLSNLVNSSKTLTDAAFIILLALAEFKPLNSEDPITLEPILDINSVFVSTGHQFDIVSLLHYHTIRMPRDTDSIGKKWLLNPITNSKFSHKDFRHIQSIAFKKQLITYPLNKQILIPDSDIICVSDVLESLLIFFIAFYILYLKTNQNAVFSLATLMNTAIHKLAIPTIFALVGAIFYGILSPDAHIDYLRRIIFSFLQNDHYLGTFHLRLLYLEYGITLAVLSLGNLLTSSAETEVSIPMTGTIFGMGLMFHGVFASEHRIRHPQEILTPSNFHPTIHTY